MYKISALIFFATIAINTMPTALHAADPHADKAMLSVEYVNGYTLGQYLSQHYQEKERQQFLEGFQSALRSENPNTDLTSEINKIKLNLLSDNSLPEVTKAAYAFGYLSGLDPKLKGYTLDYLTYLQGMIDIQNSPKIDYVATEEAQKIAKAFYKNVLKKHKTELVRINNANIEKGKMFLAENAKNKDVIQMDSGLQYKIIQKGSGPQPALKDKVNINVLGKKMNGDVFFDSKKESKEPLKINISDSIAAWRQAIIKMPKGSIWELYVPANLAYANLGWKDVIQPGEVLIYQIELVNIEK